MCVLSHVWLCSPPGSSVHGILQARILEWVAISFSSEMTLLTLFWNLHIAIFGASKQNDVDRRAHDQVGWIYFSHQPEEYDAPQLLIAGWSDGTENTGTVPWTPRGSEQERV